MADSDHPVLYRRTAPDTASALGPDFPGRETQARTSRHRDSAGHAREQLIDDLGAAHKIVFSGENDGFFRRGSGATLYPVPYSYDPNIVTKPVPVTGQIAVKVQEAGTAARTFGPLAWNVRLSAHGPLDRSWDWLHERQTSAAYPHGRFGLWYPPFVRYSTDATPSGGLTLRQFTSLPLPRDASVDFGASVIIGGVPL